MKKMTIGTTIGASFFGLALILVGSIAVSIWEVSGTSTITTRAIELRAPTARTSVALLNGVNFSLAALRGWIILGSDNFKKQRIVAWEGIDESLAAMEGYSQSWTNPENIERLKEMNDLFGKFRGFQQEIEDIAQKPENTPATVLLLQKAAPQANILVTNITKMIDLEGKLPATPRRKALLGMMADVRGTTARGLANIRAFLLSGNPVFKERFDGMWAKNVTRFGDLQRNRALFSPEQVKLFEEFEDARRIFSPLPSEMFEIRSGKEWNLANRWLGTKAAPTAGRIVAVLDGMAVNQQKLLSDDSALAKSRTERLLLIQWILLGVGVFFSLFLGFVVTRNISRLINALKNTISSLSDTATQLTDASGQVAVSSQSLAEGSSEQAASLEETSSTLEEFSSMTQQNADNTSQADTLAGEARQQSEQGANAMGRMVTAINDIKTSSDQTAKIIKSIDEIAFQTNLLALNAAVEAARAGDAGKGFAVVAEEVRNLAQRSAEAARTTSDMIEDSQKKSEAGVQVANDVNTVLGEVTTRVQKVSDLLKEIAAASSEQSKGMEQINGAVGQMDQLTQSNAANAEETAAASQQLSSQAIQVSAAVGSLQALVGGAAVDGGALAGGAAVAALPAPHAGPKQTFFPASQGNGGKAAKRTPAKAADHFAGGQRSLREKIREDQSLEASQLPKELSELEEGDFKDM